MRTRTRRLLPALLGVFALLLAACPEDIDEPTVEEPVDEESPVEETPVEEPVDEETPVEEAPVEEAPVEEAPVEEPAEDVTLTESCANEAVGFVVDYREGWVVNEEGLPPCSTFDPEEADIPEVGEIPADIAVVIHDDRVEFERAIDFDADIGVEAIAEEDTAVDGRTAIVAELEHTGEGLYPGGWRSYTYIVDLEPHALRATTFDLEEAGPPTYEERRDILDAMMDSLAFTEGG